MSALGQKQFHWTQPKVEAQKYFDEELRATNAQRNSFSLSKTSFSPGHAQRNRGSSEVTQLGLDREHIGGLKEQHRHNKRQTSALPHRGAEDQIRREE